MANTKQAKKRAAQNLKRRACNRAVVTRVRNIVRTQRATSESDAAKGRESFPATVSTEEGLSEQPSKSSHLRSASSTGVWNTRVSAIVRGGPRPPS